MHIETLKIQNFRRLKDVTIELASDISIFVGANNSGKTAAAHALQLFTSGARERFSLNDFSVESWPAIDAWGDEKPDVVLPSICMDLWFSINDDDLHLVIDLLPSLMWKGTLVGLRVEFSAVDPNVLLSNFKAARDEARAHTRKGENGAPDFVPPPRTLREYLDDNLRREFDFRFYVLDRAHFDDSFVALDGYSPRLLSPEKGRSGKDILSSLLRFDFLQAQRHLTDGAGGNRSEDLSRSLSRYYDRHLTKLGTNFDTLRALTDAESKLDAHLQEVFRSTLENLETLGWPGLNNPRLLIRSALKPVTILASGESARVHYALNQPKDGEELQTLPDRYNGLGFKNLIYMVIELLDRHHQWISADENRPPLHLIYIEEPEAHLHAQLQQVFIRQILEILAQENDDALRFTSQVVVTTHSAHILYERGFRPIRYFRRTQQQASDVLNLSIFYKQTKEADRNFLERYLKLTHCDLFFADAAVLVEGNVERLLLPQMIEKAAPRLKAACLSILEIGGAFGHRFKPLIDFLGITTLIITDIDSVSPKLSSGSSTDEDDEEDSGKACPVGTAGAVTSNQTLIKWLPKKSSITDLLAADAAARSETGAARVRVTYQTKVPVTWKTGNPEKTENAELAGRTLEEAFALENLIWCQGESQKELGLRIRGGAKLPLVELAARLHKKISGNSFNKTDFALALLSVEPSLWKVPTYISEGLTWLESQITPPPPLKEAVGQLPASPGASQ